jgi:hypothetical protein
MENQTNFCCKGCGVNSTKTYMSSDTAREKECLVIECLDCGARHYADSNDVVDCCCYTASVGIVVEEEKFSPANFSVPESHQYGKMSI